MKLLITGIPGTGKTTIGNYLQSTEGYEHFDIEDILRQYGKEGLTLAEDFIKKPGEKKVITWGFIPETDDTFVIKLQDLGYKMIWFDGNRTAARKAFINRGDVHIEALDNQMAKIEKLDLKSFKPIFINTFDKNGEFLKKEKIVKLILDIKKRKPCRKVQKQGFCTLYT